MNKTQLVIESMLSYRPIYVRTPTRNFYGKVYEVGISPFTDDVRARVVDSEGRVHYFRVEKADVWR